MVPCYEGVGFDACGVMRKDLRFPEWGWRLQAIFSLSSDRVRNLRTDFLKTSSCSLGHYWGYVWDINTTVVATAMIQGLW